MTYKGLARPFLLSNGVPALELDKKDRAVWVKVLSRAIEKGKRVSVTAFVERRDRTDPQLRLYWAVLTVLYTAVHGVKPTEDEKLIFHEDIKELYANRRISTLRPGVLIPMGFREGDTQDASTLIDGVFQELALASLARSEEMEAREFYQQYWAMGGQKYNNEQDFRARATLCAADGKGGVPMEPWIQLAHMESRGANPARTDDPKDWIPLCPDCHREQHQIGVERFLLKYPHLEKRWSERN